MVTLFKMVKLDSMTKHEYEWCRRIIEKLKTRKCYSYFDKQLPRNSAIIKQNEIALIPTDISLVVQKLEQNENYKLIEFVKDMRQVWYYAMSINTRENPYYLMASDFSKWFEKEINKYTQCDEEKWIYKLNKARIMIKDLVQTTPESLLAQPENNM